MKRKRIISSNVIIFALLILICILLAGCGDNKTKDPSPEYISIDATKAIESVAGKVYTFSKDDTYKFSSTNEYEKSDSADTYGTFRIMGVSMKAEKIGEKSGVPAYSVPEGHIAIQYSYEDKYKNTADDEWHLVDDNIATVDVLTIGSNIRKGAIILQKSMDHLNWYTISVQTNSFADMPVQNEAVYETTDIEMINGCYFRLLVVYEMGIKTGTSSVLLVFPKDEYDYKRIAEVYEFYAVNTNEHIEELDANANRHRLGDKVLVSDFASYSGEKEITKGDLHYGWDLGSFFVSGFTSKTKHEGNWVFLKNVGDVVTLWFNLEQNINALNNDGGLTITADNDGQDQYFETPMTNFGRGMLIIRYTDYENVKHTPVMYYDYLSANTMLGANTRVQLFEEGDYEVALDYEVHKGSQTHHYRIFFTFSVRNANCMVYPFDIATGAELTNSAVAPNGFYLDLARSRYLDIFIKKEIWTEGAEGLTEDTRFNTAAKEGKQYSDEGIYTITVKNKYTGLTTTKKIYVGTNRILLAYMNSNYSIKEIQQMVDHGAIIYEDGTIVTLDGTKTNEPVPDTETNLVPLTNPIEISPEKSDEENLDRATTIQSEERGNDLTLTIVAISVVAIVIVVIGISKKRSGKEEKK